MHIDECPVPVIQLSNTWEIEYYHFRLNYQPLPVFQLIWSVSHCLREDTAVKTEGVGVYLGGETQDTKGSKV